MDSSIYVEVVGKCRVLRALPSPVLAFRSVHVVSVPSSVIHLHGSTPTKYGLLLNQDDKCRAVKKQLATYSGLPVASLLLVEVFGACIKVGRNNCQLSLWLRLMFGVSTCSVIFHHCNFLFASKGKGEGVL